MFQCGACGILYLTQREADLCTPREGWAERYPHLVDQEITAGNSCFSNQEIEDQKND